MLKSFFNMKFGPEHSGHVHMVTVHRTIWVGALSQGLWSKCVVVARLVVKKCYAVHTNSGTPTQRK